jgi:hypothetical protein
LACDRRPLRSAALRHAHICLSRSAGPSPRRRSRVPARRSRRSTKSHPTSTPITCCTPRAARRCVGSDDETPLDSRSNAPPSSRRRTRTGGSSYSGRGADGRREPKPPQDSRPRDAEAGRPSVIESVALQRGSGSGRFAGFLVTAEPAEADGNRTRLGTRAPTPVLKTGGPTRNPDASATMVPATTRPPSRLFRMLLDPFLARPASIVQERTPVRDAVRRQLRDRRSKRRPAPCATRSRAL